MSQSQLENLEATKTLAQRLGLTPDVLVQAFRSNVLHKLGNSVRDDEVVPLLVIANQYDLNPFFSELYASRTPEGAIIPVVTLDGWTRILNREPQFNGHKFIYSEEEVEEPATKQLANVWIECEIHRKDREHSSIAREFFRENYQQPVRNPENGALELGSWQTMPNRRLRHRAFIQAARLAFAITGIYDENDVALMNHTRTAKEPHAGPSEDVSNEVPGQEMGTQAGAGVTQDNLVQNMDRIRTLMEPIIARARELNAWDTVRDFILKTKANDALKSDAELNAALLLLKNAREKAKEALIEEADTPHGLDVSLEPYASTKDELSHLGGGELEGCVLANAGTSAFPPDAGDGLQLKGW